MRYLTIIIVLSLVLLGSCKKWRFENNRICIEITDENGEVLCAQLFIYNTGSEPNFVDEPYPISETSGYAKVLSCPNIAGQYASEIEFGGLYGIPTDIIDPTKDLSLAVQTLDDWGLQLSTFAPQHQIGNIDVSNLRPGGYYKWDLATNDFTYVGKAGPMERKYKREQEKIKQSSMNNNTGGSTGSGGSGSSQPGSGSLTVGTYDHTFSCPYSGSHTIPIPKDGCEKTNERYAEVFTCNDVQNFYSACVEFFKCHGQPYGHCVNFK